MMLIPGRWYGVAALLASLGLAACGADSDEPEWVVRTQAGDVRGVERNGVTEFRGIPYAASPAGEARWSLPRPPAPWPGIRDADAFGPDCPQTARYNLTEASDQEDCLSLNVTVPTGTLPADGNRLRPVMVWIHGGAFVGGSSALYRLDALARAGDIVVVSFNYRLGVFGFMAHPAFAAPTNGGYGLEDQRAALRWVQRNIARFGGDPARVTLAGESAGAGSVCMHLLAPEQTRGLFQQAIIQSASCIQPLRTVAEGDEIGESVATHEAVNCPMTEDPAATLACLRAAPLDGLLAAGTVASADITAFMPVIGNQTVPRQGADAIREGDFLRVPLINGGTRDEMRLYVGYYRQDGLVIDAQTYRGWLTQFYGDAPQRLDRIEAAYPVDTTVPVPEQLGTALSDFNPQVGLNQCAYLSTSDRIRQHGVPVYQFEFADRAAPVLGVGIPASPDPGMALGAAHASELNYLFPGFSNTRAINGPALAAASEPLAQRMLQHWTHFVATGRPSPAASPDWPLYRGGASVLRLDAPQTTVFDAGVAHHCPFWESLYPDRLGAS